MDGLSDWLGHRANKRTETVFAGQSRQADRNFICGTEQTRGQKRYLRDRANKRAENGICGTEI